MSLPIKDWRFRDVFNSFRVALGLLYGARIVVRVMDFRSENVSTMLRPALGGVAVVFARRARAAGYGHGIGAGEKIRPKTAPLNTSKGCGTRRVFCHAMGRSRVCYHHASRDVNRATLRIDNRCATRPSVELRYDNEQSGTCFSNF